MESDRQISDVVEREQSRLRNFIRQRVSDARDVEDILQDVFHALVEANRMVVPIEHVTGWLFRVARNRIIDFFRKAKEESVPEPEAGELGLEICSPPAMQARMPSTLAACSSMPWKKHWPSYRLNNGEFSSHMRFRAAVSKNWLRKAA